MSDPTFVYRVCFGLLFFGVLGFWDYKKHPKDPKRLREYLFLFATTALCMIYAVLHDFITYSISREYFIVGKGLAGVENGFNLEVVKLALMAGWTPGLLIGVSFLFANNPSKVKKQLNYSQLFKILLIPLCTSFLVAAVFGMSFYLYPHFFVRIVGLDLSLLGIDFPTFMAVWGTHIGSYLGGLIGTIFSIVKIKRLRVTA
jgi:hypothetical protein